MKRLVVAALAAAGALALAACGGTTLDTSNVEKDIQQIASTGAGVEVQAECPDEVSDATKGTTYDCQITFAGNENNVQTVKMEILDADARSDFADQERATDELVIRSIVALVDADPAAVCQRLANELRQQINGGLKGCQEEAAKADDGAPDTVKSVVIDGDSATLVTEAAGGEETTTFQRGEQGEWLVTAFE